MSYDPEQAWKELFGSAERLNPLGGGNPGGPVSRAIGRMAGAPSTTGTFGVPEIPTDLAVEPDNSGFYRPDTPPSKINPQELLQSIPSYKDPLPPPPPPEEAPMPGSDYDPDQAFAELFGGQEGFDPSQQEFSPVTDSVTGRTMPRPQAGPVPGMDFASDGPLPVVDEDYLENLETDNLHNQVSQQRGTIEYLGEEAPEKDENPGTMNRIFDVLLRPNYAVAESVSQVADNIRDGGFVQGIINSVGPPGEGRKEGQGFYDYMEETPTLGAAIIRGLTGRDKTTFSDVLDDAGVENKYVRGIGGFVLDVALDPTTYVGAGVIKKAGASVVQAAGSKAAAEVLTSPAAQKAARESAENLLQREMLEQVGPKGAKSGWAPGTFAGSGKKGATDLSSPAAQEKFIKKNSDRILREQADEKKNIAQLALQNAGKVEFKFAGKKLGESAALYSGISRAFKPLRELDSVQAMNRMFRPKAELGDMWDITQLHRGMSIGKYEDHLRLFKEQMSNFNVEQRRQISHAIEQGRYLDDPEMRTAAEHIQRMFKNMWDDEVAAGLHKKGAVARDNYVYHMYKVDPKKAKQYKSATHNKPVAGGYSKERTFPTLEEAQKAGLKPADDILEIMQERAAKHFQDMTHASIMEDAVQNYGVRVGSKEATRINNALQELTGSKLEKFTWNGRTALFPEEIVRTLRDMNTVHAQDKAASHLLRHLDKTQRGMKFWMTVANPGHHIRNFVGNNYMAYQGGVRNPKRYTQALAGVRSHAGKIGGPQEAAAKAHRIRVGKKRTGYSYSDAHEMMSLYKMAGAKSGFYDTEVAKTVTNRASQIVRKVSTGREDTARLGQFIDYIAKNAPSNWSELTQAQKAAHPVVRESAKRVRKYQLDYGDLTQFETNVARRLMMFYTFARKNTALQVEMMFTRPGKIANVPKAYSAIEQVLGVENPALEDEDFWERVPEWVQTMGAPQVGGDENFVQRILGTQDPVYANMLLPTSDLNRLQGPTGVARDFFGEIRPELKIPMEQAFGSQAFSGAPVPGGGQYISQQIPITNLLYKAAADESTNRNVGQDVFNYLSGLSTQTITPARQQSELRRQQQSVQEVLRGLREENIEEFLENARKNRPGAGG